VTRAKATGTRRPLGRAIRRPRAARQLPHGFTLIELLVVIAILALLVAILTPSLKRGRQLAVLAACASNQRQAFVAIALYAEEHQEYPTRTTWEAGLTNRGQEHQGTGVDPYQNLLIALNYAAKDALQCAEKSLYPGTNRFDHFVTEPWLRYNGPSTVGYWVWHYGHGAMFQYYGWHWYTWANPPASSSRGPSFRKPAKRPDGRYEYQALGCCPRSLICPPDWSFGYAHEPHLDRPRSADTPMECQFGNLNTTRSRNYFFTDGHAESIIND